jgi:hypothetical protein
VTLWPAPVILELGVGILGETPKKPRKQNPTQKLRKNLCENSVKKIRKI